MLGLQLFPTVPTDDRCLCTSAAQPTRTGRNERFMGMSEVSFPVVFLYQVVLP